MTYAGHRKIIDADSHLIELDDFLANHAAESEKHLIPAMNEQKELPVVEEKMATGRDAFIKRQQDPAVMEAFEKDLLNNKKSGWSRLGTFDPDERSHTLNLFGFEMQLVLPTYAYHQVGHATDPEVAEAGARALNNAMGAFCAKDDRLKAIGYIPLRLGPEIAGKLMDEGFAAGCYSFMVDTNEPNPENRSFTHPDFDPVWARFAERKAPFVVHIAVTGEYQPVSKSFHNNSYSTPELGGDAPMGSIGMVAASNTVELFLAAMIFDNVFIRHPELKGISMEFGAGWVPSWLHSLDFSANLFKPFQPHLKEQQLSASELARKHLKFAPFAGESIGWIIDQVGPDLLVFASDYPHPEGTADPIKKFEDTMENCDQETMDAFYYKNMEDVMGLKLESA